VQERTLVADGREMKRLKNLKERAKELGKAKSNEVTYICAACGQKVDPTRVHLSEIDDKHFKLDGQRLVVRGWVDDRDVKATVGIFVPEVIDGLAPAIVGVLNRYNWLALGEDGELREDQVTT